MFEQFIDLRDGLQLVKRQVKLKERRHIEHTCRDSRVHQLVVRDTQVLQDRELGQVAVRDAVDVVIIGVEHQKRRWNSRGKFLELVLARVQQNEGLQAFEGTCDALGGQLVLGQVDGGQVFHPRQGVSRERTQLVADQLQLIQRLRKRTRGFGQLVITEEELLQFAQFIKGTGLDLVTGDVVVVQDEPAKVGGVIEYASLDLLN